MWHIIEAGQFDRDTISRIFHLADTPPERQKERLKGKILASLFYEPSTRTRFSFESAMLRLGGSIITTENAREFSSAAKGETLEDTIRIVSHYADCIVLRHFERGAAKRAMRVSQISIVNAGDGNGEHPTQALLDLYTIRKELKKSEGISIAFVGDLKNGRTVRSLAQLLTHYADIRIFFVSPRQLGIGSDIKVCLAKHRIAYEEYEDFEGILSEVDVLYMTRIQKERFEDPEEYEAHKDRYLLTLQAAKRMKQGSIIMHPLPRLNEIDPAVDTVPGAVYFKQAKYGLSIRMALLSLLCGADTKE